MTLRQRQPRQRDETHLAHVRLQPCCVCGSVRAIEAAHIRMANPFHDKRETGMAERPDDKWTVPLCHYHHQSSIVSQHNVGEEVFWREIHGRDPFAIALRLWDESGGAERALIVRPVRVKKIKARKPVDYRKKIQAGRKIQSNPVIQSRGFEKRANRSVPA